MTELNSNQLLAAQHVDGPLLVLAGAGSGKTRTIIHRILHLLEIGVLPSDILALTFTNKAAEEMKSRIRALKNVGVLACTFHSLGAKILRESISFFGFSPDFTIYDAEDREKLLKTAFEELEIPKEKSALKEVSEQISEIKNQLLDGETIADSELKKIYLLYQKKLKASNAVDFDDLLYLTVKLLKESREAAEEYQNRWLFILIDEYQDTNFVQDLLIKELTKVHHNLFAVGDPDQSIYSWRGAIAENILDFPKNFPGAQIITLDQNYRSTNYILKASNALIAHNGQRFEKKLWSALGEGEKIKLYIAQNDRSEADFVAKEIFKRKDFNSIAIFYRTNAQSRIFEDILLAYKIPYTIVGGLSFYARKEIKDILAFLRLILSDSDLLAFLRTIHLPKRGFGKVVLEKLCKESDEKNLPILLLCKELLQSPQKFSTSLSKKQREALSDYLSMIEGLRAVHQKESLFHLIEELLRQSRYLSYLEEDRETVSDRKENINELLAKAFDWEKRASNPSLSLFLEELSLHSTKEENIASSVKLMTLHNSKGLEFETVFLVGLEEDLLPHINSKESIPLLEEERRLCYVGMTRAKQYLYLTACMYRFVWGTSRPMRPSRFLKEIPLDTIENLSPFSFFSEESTEEFSIGEKVEHMQFGQGIIQDIYEGSFGLTYEVSFPDSETTRTLAAKFAKLKKV